jgi:hypothetical protein
MVSIYCDESGFSGNNLLDREQEFFVFASLGMESEEACSLVTQAAKDFDLQGNELKGSNLLKTPRGRRAVSFLIKRSASRAKVLVHLKKYALASKFFEYIFEPTFSDCNSLYYQVNFHRFISHVLYCWFVARQESAEQLFEEFSQMMRSLDPNKMVGSFPRDVLLINTDDVINQITLFAFLNRRPVIEELSVIRGNWGEQNWVLDLTMSSLFSLLSLWAEKYEVLEVYCDESKPLKAEVSFLDHMVGREERIRFGWPGGKERLVTFNLARSPKLVDSRQCPGIQIADVVAATLAWTMRNSATKEARRWYEALRACICEDSILPDEAHLDLTQQEPFVNALILNELVDRSLKKQNLCRGMAEFIAAAHRVYEDYKSGLHPRAR